MLCIINNTYYFKAIWNWDFMDGRKKIVREDLPKYNPVDTSPKFSAISLANYEHNDSLTQRVSNGRTPIGYCAQEPVEALRFLMPRFHVTSYCGIELFEINDVGRSTPMAGLAIDAIGPLYGIGGKVQEIAKLKETQRTIREKEFSQRGRKKIVTGFRRTLSDKRLKLNPDYNNIVARIEEVCSVVSSLRT
jgi:hypothetical protein